MTLTQTLHTTDADFQQLLKSYSRSKIRRIVAAYNDTPPHLRHQVPGAFGVQAKLPVQYQRYLQTLKP